jgi:hypothetical protein
MIFLQQSDLTSSSDMSEINENDSRVSCNEDVSMDEPLIRLRKASCSSVTSQASVSESIYHCNEEKENVQNESVEVGKTNEDNIYNNKHNLPIRLESIVKNINQDLLNNTIEKVNLPNDASNNIFNIDKCTKSCNEVNVTNEKDALSNIPDLLDKLIPRYNQEDIEKQNSEQDNNQNNEKSMEINLNNMPTLVSNMKDSEKCLETSFNQKSQEALLLQESNEVLHCKKNESSVKSNIITEHSKIVDEDNILFNKSSISDSNISTNNSSPKKNTSEGVINMQIEEEKRSIFDDSSIVSNKLSDESFGKKINDEIEDKGTIEFSPETTDLNNVDNESLTLENTDKSDSATQSKIEIQKNTSFIDKSNNVFNISATDMEEENNTSSDDDFSVSLTPNPNDKEDNKICNEYSTDESSNEKSFKFQNPKTCNVPNKSNMNLSGGFRKKLLSKIRNLSRNSKKPMFSNKIELGTSQSKEKLNNVNDATVNKLPNNSNIIVESIPTLELPKKQRIAHTPKSINFNLNNVSNNQVKDKVKQVKSVSKDTTEDSVDKVSTIMDQIDKIFKVKLKVPCTSSTSENFSVDNALTKVSHKNDSNSTSLYHENQINYDKHKNHSNNVDTVRKSNGQITEALTSKDPSSEITIKSIKENYCSDTEFNDQDENFSVNERKNFVLKNNNNYCINSILYE